MGEDQEPAAEQPTEVGQHAVEQLVRIENRNLDVENVGEGLHPLGAQTLLAPVEQLLAGAGRLVLGETRGQQLLAEVLQVFELEALGAEALLVLLLSLVQRVLAV